MGEQAEAYAEWREGQEKARPVRTDEEIYTSAAEQIHRMRDNNNRMEIHYVEAAIKQLRKTILPAAYVEGIRGELYQMLGTDMGERTSVYLAFFGAGDQADYMKIGIARNVGRRMDGLRSGNPMMFLTAYSAPFVSRQAAARVEAGLLEFYRESRANGEWVRLSSPRDREGCRAIVESLCQVATGLYGREVEFKPDC